MCPGGLLTPESLSRGVAGDAVPCGVVAGWRSRDRPTPTRQFGQAAPLAEASGGALETTRDGDGAALISGSGRSGAKP